MLTLLYDQDEIVAQFVAALIPHCRRRGFGKCKAIGVLDEDGRLIGGMVYSNWDPDAGTIEMSGAATDPRWLTQRTLWALFSYPFIGCGCQMVLMRVQDDNERLLRQLAVFGFAFVKQRRMFGRDRDGVIASLTEEEWVENKFSERLARRLAQRPEFSMAAE